MSAKTSGSDAKSANGTAQNRSHHDGSSTRAFTIEQKAAVIRVRRCGATAFYDILGLESEKSTVTDAGIKKAYRKLSLLTHPDKNGYDGADEAFKMVSRAFQILSDPDKKKQYDATGGDPDSRFGGAGARAASNPFAGFARPAGAGRGGAMFEEEISPEEIFRQFFGGGMGGFGGGPFGGGPFGNSSGVFFNMGGGPGIRVHQFGGGGPRRRPADATNTRADQPTAGQALQNLLPLLVLFIIPLLSSLFSADSYSTSAPKLPIISIDTPNPPLTQLRESKNLKVPYYVNPTDVTDYKGKDWHLLDQSAEKKLVSHLDVSCNQERRRQQRLFDDARGWFFIDEDKYEAARTYPTKSCDRLRGLGYHVGKVGY